MGIYDREYYRREGPSFLQAFATQGQVCKWLIIINVIAFLVQLIDKSGRFTALFWLDADRVLHGGEVWRLLTYAFLHDPHDLLHIVFNMLFLWWFGHELETMYGHWEFLTFYLVAAVLGGAGFTLAHLLGMDASLCIGASGAVTAVMVVFAFHFPRYIILLFLLIPVPIWLLVVFQVAQDTFGLLSHDRLDVNRVAVTVHLAGAAFGALYYKLHWRLTSLWPQFRSSIRQRSRPKLRVYRDEEGETPHPVSVPSAPAADVDEQLEAKLDAVLEKVARSGQASLTESEKQILLRASEIYKKRRS